MRVLLLGSLEVTDDDGRSLDVGGSRLQALLVRLALDAGRTVTAASLVDAVWEDELPVDEIHALQSLISRLRRGLGDPTLVARAAGGYRLVLEPGATDVHRFEGIAREGGAALRAGDAAGAAAVLRDGLALWRGPALAGVAGERRFAAAAAARLDDLRLAATVDRIEADLALGVGAAGLVTELERLAGDHPLDERLARQLIRVLSAAGRQADALAAYERVRSRLAEELGAGPSPELRAVHLAVLRGEPDHAAPPRRERPPGARTNLRVPLTSFVGRDDEIERLAAALEQYRLVTLIGPGGVGKTRLAEEAAARWIDRVPDGVWLVELAPVGEESEVVQTLLGSLRLRDVNLLERGPALAAGDAMRRVLEGVADRTALILLDNCEHLIGAVAAIAEELLGRCPGVRIVATSREPLGIAGERLLDVPPLPWPEPDAGAQEALAHPAVELFADRAVAAGPGFVVDDGNVRAVVEICRRLDGLPLAIELAAARLRSLSAQQIAQRLDDRFRLLTGGSRTAMPRHRTLRAVVDWSWELLTEPERALARRLAVFPGGATPESAAAVCAGPELPAAEVFDLLAALVDRSLLQVVDAGAPRYRTLETIREYARERLEEAGELVAVSSAHARYFAGLVEDLEPRLRTADQLGPLALLSAERENVVAALRQLVDGGDATAALRLAVSLPWFALLSGNMEESLGWLRLALEAKGEANPVDRAVAECLVALADAARSGAHSSGAEAGASGEFDQELIAEVAGRLEAIDTERRPLVALVRPMLVWLGGDRERAERLLGETGRHPDPWVRAAAPLLRAQLAENEGDIDGMRDDLDRALAAFRAVGDRWGLAMTLLSRSQVLMLDAELDAAAAVLDEGRALSAQLGGRTQDAMLELRLAEVRLRRGDVDGAREHLGRLAELHELGPDEALIVQAARSRVAWLAGERAEARDLRAELIRHLEQVADIRPDRGRARAIALAAVAFSWLQDGDLEAAEQALTAAHAAALASTDMPIVASVGLVSAALAVRLGDAGDAAEMLGAAARLRGAEDPTNQDVATLVARIRATLGDDGFEAAYARGREADRDAAMARLHPASRALDAPAVRP